MLIRVLHFQFFDFVVLLDQHPLHPFNFQGVLTYLLNEPVNAPIVQQSALVHEPPRLVHDCGVGHTRSSVMSLLISSCT